MILHSPTTNYQVDALVAETADYRVYVCVEQGTGKCCLLQISTTSAGNGPLDKSAFLLKKLANSANEYEIAYAKLGNDHRLSYDRLFPALVESFIAPDQGGRRANILAVVDVESPLQMFPLSNLRHKDNVLIALSSSAWVMGRLLKLLVFAHDQGVAVNSITANNILIEPKQHIVTVFDWSEALIYTSEVPMAQRRSDIAKSAEAILGAVGANLHTGDCPQVDDSSRPYITFLFELSNGSFGNAEATHQQFYKIVERVFGRGFNPLKTIPIT